MRIFTGDRNSAPQPSPTPAPEPRVRVRTDYKPDIVLPKGPGAERTPDRTSLRDLYNTRKEGPAERSPDAQPKTGQPKTGIGSPDMRDNLADRYRQRLDRDTKSAGPKDAPESRKPGADRPEERKDNTPPVAKPSPRNEQPKAESPKDRAPRVDVPKSDVPTSTPRTKDGAPRHIPDHGDALPRKDAPIADRYRPEQKPRTEAPTTGGGLRVLEPRLRTPGDIVGPTTPRLGGPSTIVNSFRGSNPNHYFHSSHRWSSHCSSLWFGFGFTPRHCRWGFYSYPFYWSCYWPQTYYRSSCWFDFYWNSCLRWRNVRFCWSWPLFRGWSWDSVGYHNDAYDWAYWDYSPRVVVHEVVREAEPEVEIVSAGPEPELPLATPKKLAERYVRLGDFYFNEARFKEASESYLRALTYAPDDGSIHFVLADSLFALGDYHYAAYVIGRGIQNDPGLASADVDKRKFYADPKLFDRQLGTLRNYVAEKPYDAAAHLVLGYNLHFSNDDAGAKQAFEKVLSIDPHQEAAKVFLTVLTKPATAVESTESGTKVEAGATSRPTTEPAKD